MADILHIFMWRWKIRRALISMAVKQVSLELNLHLLNRILFIEKFSKHVRIEPFTSAFLTRLLVTSFSDGETDVK